jgi:RNA polymerase sigma-70 factor (ECF subfamily)
MDEQAVIRRCLEGDAGSFQQIVAAHESPLMAMAMTILGNRQDAEDIVQETFIQAYRHLASFDSGRNLRSWLCTVLYRRCLNAIKRKKKILGILNRLKAEHVAWAPAHDHGADERSLLPAEVFNVLNAKERTVLSLWANEGYTAAEIAAVLGCPAGTARYYLFNVRRKIRSFSERSHENMPRH